MHTTLINTLLCVFIVIIGITYSSTSSIGNDDYAPADIDGIDLDMNYPGHELDIRAMKSRFWKRAPQRKFWKRSAMDNENMVKSLSNKFQQHDKH